MEGYEEDDEAASGGMFEGGAESCDTEPTCGVCLDPVAERGEVEGCVHLFCFGCIEQWAKVHDPPQCPMCKIAFTRILKHVAVDPLDLLLADEDDPAPRAAPTVVNVGPQPRASRPG